MPHQKTRRRITPLLFYLLLTVVLVAVLAGLFFLLLRLGSPWGVIGAALLLFVVIRYTGVLQVYYTPVVSEVLEDYTLTTDAGTLRGVVEVAYLKSGRYGTVTRVLRLSLYAADTGKRKHRYLIGDSAVYLGRHGGKLWFFARDKFYSGKNGLLGRDEQTGKLSTHLPLRNYTMETGPINTSTDTIVLKKQPTGEAVRFNIATGKFVK